MGDVAVAGVFEEYPLDFSRPELRAIRDVLARAIYRPGDIDRIVDDAGINPGEIDYSGTAALQWHSILKQARSELRMDGLLAAVHKRMPLVAARIDELAAPQPVLEPSTGPPDELSQPDGAGWRGFGNEKLIIEGSDTLLGISFLSTGISRSRSICRLLVTYEPGRGSTGTGALIGPDLLLTNHHVLYDWDTGGRPATAVEAWFGYELGEDSHTRGELAIVGCDHRTIDGDRAQDWAVVSVSGASVPVPTGTPVLSLRGAEPPRKDDYVFIIQHPDGGPKMIGLSHNLVRYVDDDVVQYWTDTKEGSSGAPVFNSRWQVVGLHHRWVSAPAGDGVAYRNQGRRIERVIAGLVDHGFEVN
jgi:V8-like Glu-specific endopeptidase